MQPLINLKQFLAVLALLIIPAALFTAYFRNNQPASGGGVPGHHAIGGQSAPMADHDTRQTPTGGQMDHSKMTGAASGQAPPAPSGGDTKQPPAGGQMDHSKMTGGAAQQGAAPAPDAKQLEASRAQLEASRAQLEASRQALEATKTQPAPKEGKPPAAGAKPAEPAPPADPEKKPDAPKSGKAPDGHAHKH